MSAVSRLFGVGDRRGMAGGGCLLLVILSVTIAASDFTLFLPLTLSLSALLHAAVVIMSILAMLASPRINKPLARKLFVFAVFALIFAAWGYLLLLNSGINLVLVSGLMLLCIWYGVQGRYQLWLGAAVALTLLVLLGVFSPLPVKALAVYLLLLLAALSVAVYSRSHGGALGLTQRASERDYLPESVNVELEAQLEPVTDLEAEIATVKIDEPASTNWEQVLRELHGELKNTADIDALLKKMLVFISGTIEIEAAAVGMIQERTLNRITQFGPDEMVSGKTLAWNNERIRTLINTQQAMVNQQDHVSHAGQKEKLYRIDVPVISNAKTVGIVTLLRTSLLFNESEVVLASAIVFHSMIALRQARLQDEVKRLTGASANKTLFTREQFVEKAKKELEKLDKPRVFSLLILEVDNFDEVQDKYGREAAARVSKTVAGALMGQMRNDDVIGSYGKEGFILLLHETDLLQAKAVAEQMRNKVAQAKVKLSDGVIGTTVSIGLTTAGEKGEDMPSLIRKADMGLFVAKENGRNTVKVSL